jgi:hypothetical protein
VIVYRATVGSDVGSLGRDTCSECDPLRPLTPMMLSDGRLLIADLVNARWVVVTNGTPSIVPFAFEGDLGDAVVGNGDIVYVAVTSGGGVGLSPRSVVVAYSAHDLSTPRWEIEGYQQPLVVEGNDLVTLTADFAEYVRLPQLVERPEPVPSITPSLNATPPELVVSDGDAAIRWILPNEWFFQAPVILADDSVAVTGVSNTGGVAVFVRLTPDGRWSLTSIPQGAVEGYNGRFQPAGTDLLGLSGGVGADWQVVRLPLAAPTAH